MKLENILRGVRTSLLAGSVGISGLVNPVYSSEGISYNDKGKPVSGNGIEKKIDGEQEAKQKALEEAMERGEYPVMKTIMDLAFDVSATMYGEEPRIANEENKEALTSFYKFKEALGKEKWESIPKKYREKPKIENLDYPYLYLSEFEKDWIKTYPLMESFPMLGALPIQALGDDIYTDPDEFVKNKMPKQVRDEFLKLESEYINRIKNASEEELESIRKEVREFLHLGSHLGSIIKNPKSFNRSDRLTVILSSRPDLKEKILPILGAVPKGESRMMFHSPMGCDIYTDPDEFVKNKMPKQVRDEFLKLESEYINRIKNASEEELESIRKEVREFLPWESEIDIKNPKSFNRSDRLTVILSSRPDLREKILDLDGYYVAKLIKDLKDKKQAEKKRTKDKTKTSLYEAAKSLGEVFEAIEDLGELYEAMETLGKSIGSVTVELIESSPKKTSSKDK